MPTPKILLYQRELHTALQKPPHDIHQGWPFECGFECLRLDCCQVSTWLVFFESEVFILKCDSYLILLTEPLSNKAEALVSTIMCYAFCLPEHWYISERVLRTPLPGHWVPKAESKRKIKAWLVSVSCLLIQIMYNQQSQCMLLPTYISNTAN